MYDSNNDILIQKIWEIHLIMNEETMIKYVLWIVGGLVELTKYFRLFRDSLTNESKKNWKRNPNLRKTVIEWVKKANRLFDN